MTGTGPGKRAGILHGEGPGRPGCNTAAQGGARDGAPGVEAQGAELWAPKVHRSLSRYREAAESSPGLCSCWCSAMECDWPRESCREGDRLEETGRWEGKAGRGGAS